MVTGPTPKLKLLYYEIIKKSPKFHHCGHENTAELVPILGTLFINYTVW